MPLDGMFLHMQSKELKTALCGYRIDKVYQPTVSEIVFSLRHGPSQVRLLLSARSNSPRCGITLTDFDNPASPPMFCMLLRKRLIGALVLDVAQEGMDRVLSMTLSASDNIGDREILRLYIEIMGTYSNIVLTREDGTIIDCLRRTDSHVRSLSPGYKYLRLPPQEKADLLRDGPADVLEKLHLHTSETVGKALLLSMSGASPALCNDIVSSAGIKAADVSGLTADENAALETKLIAISKMLSSGESTPSLIYDKNTGKNLDFSFYPMTSSFSNASSRTFDSLSALLESFYKEKDFEDRIRIRTSELRRTMNNARSRTEKKLKLQTKDLESCKDRELLRIKAELISANIYQLSKGMTEYAVPNYYDDGNIMKIKADPALSPAANSQKYYKEYRKTYNAEKMLVTLIEKDREDLEYIDSVLDSLSRAASENELSQIKNELMIQGYIKKNRSRSKKQKLPPAAPPVEYTTSDGYTVLVGRNNTANDKLSLKTADKSDMWLHVKDAPGSHVILKTQNGEISDTALYEAAQIAVRHSSVKNSSNVPVDYTPVKNLKKPAGAKPGKVIYHVYNTITVKNAT